LNIKKKKVYCLTYGVKDPVRLVPTGLVTHPFTNVVLFKIKQKKTKTFLNYYIQ